MIEKNNDESNISKADVEYIRHRIGVLEDSIGYIRHEISELTENTGLDLSKVSPEHLSSILFSDDPNETLVEEAANLSKENKGKLLFREARLLFGDMSFVKIDIGDVKFDQATFRLALNHLVDIFNPEICTSSTEDKKELVLSLASNVTHTVAQATGEQNALRRADHCDPIEIERYEFCDENCLDVLIEMISKTFPLLELTKEEILN